MQTSENQQLNRESYKGTRDFYPQEMALQTYLFNTMRQTVEQFGYVEYGASLLEETALYTAKSGEEIVNEQTYSFTDRGGREVTIRPEMTPTVARMVAKQRQELAFPARWYSIPNLFRYEKPQRGRMREHWQLNVDVFGIHSFQAELEIITLAAKIMHAFGAQPGMFEIKINSRTFFNWLVTEKLKLQAEQAHQVAKLLDRKNKISSEAFTTQLKELITQPNEYEIFLKTIHTDSVSELLTLLPEAPGLKDLGRVIDQLKENQITNIVFDPSLMRGFDYYTGIVFEVFDTDVNNNRSLFGGGRYDHLVEMFGVDPVTAVGFGMGDVTLKDFLETHNLLPKLPATTQLYICRTEQTGSLDAAAIKLAGALRENGMRVAVDYTDRKLPAQLKAAGKMNIPYALVLGESELKSERYPVKNLETREQESLTVQEIIEKLQK